MILKPLIYHLLNAAFVLSLIRHAVRHPGVGGLNGSTNFLPSEAVIKAGQGRSGTCVCEGMKACRGVMLL